VASSRRDSQARRRAHAADVNRRAQRPLGREGERPAGPFGGLPISELAILAGIIAFVVGIIGGGGPALVVGIIVCGLGVMEITAREHFSGYRSHTVLLAALPAVAVEAAIVLIFGEPRRRPLVLVAVVPVFLILFWALRRRFLVARQARIARLPVAR
jgi:hypothetical protein